MGILSNTAETFEVPNWMMVHPELEYQLNLIETPVFMITYVIIFEETRAKIFNKSFSVAEILNKKQFGIETLKDLINNNRDRIADHIIETIRTINHTDGFRFVGHVDIS